MPKLRLADEELKNILNDYNAGISMADVGAKYHHNPGTLKRYFIEHNIPVRTREEGLRASLKNRKVINLNGYIGLMRISFQNKILKWLMF